MKSRPSHDFLYLPAYAKAEFCINTTKAMAGKPAVYDPPKIPYATIVSAAEDLRKKYSVWHKEHSEEHKNLYEQADAVLNELMLQQAEYVAFKANGDMVIISDAGFPATQGKRHNPPLPGTPENVKVQHATAASIRVSCKSMGRAARVLTYVCILMAEEWVEPIINGTTFTFSREAKEIIIDNSKKRVKIFKNLMPGVYYYAAMYVVNTTGAGPISTPVRIMAAD